MTTAARQRNRTAQPGEGEWLARLLADVNQEVAEHPRPEAINRIRDRLLSAIKPPARAAA